MQPTNGSLIQQWFNADGLNTDKLMKLSENTINLSTFLTNTYDRLSTNQESTDKIVSMSRRILNEFEGCYHLEKKGKDPLRFEKWAAAHSRMGPEGNLEGVYQDLHILFEAIRNIEAKEGINTNNPLATGSPQLEFLQMIEDDVKNTFMEDWKHILLPDQQDIQREIFLHDMKAGGKMKMTSKDNYMISRLELVNMLNKEKIDLSS